jgi:hypothetical protein
VGGRPFTWRDAIAHARATGSWEILERQIVEGVALLHARGSTRPTPDELREAANAFRYDRNLVAAEELEAWLARWGVTVDEWMDHIRRSVLLDAYAETGTPHTELEPTSEETLMRLWPSAVCSGTLARAAWDLAEQLATRDGLEEANGTVIDPSDAKAELRQRVVTEDALATEVQSRVLDWVRIGLHVLTFAHEDAAREGIALMRQDGLKAHEVADIAQADLQHRIEYLEEVDEDLRPMLMGSAKGDVFGPLAGDGAWRVVVVHDKVVPSLDDPDIRLRAEESIVSRAIRRDTDERVVWHGDP